MSRHAVMERRPARSKTFRLGVIHAGNEPHELARDVEMKPGWPERVLHGEPPRWKDHEVEIVDPRGVADRLKHQEDRRIGMIVTDRAQGVEKPQVVLVQRVIAMPGHDVER